MKKIEWIISIVITIILFIAAIVILFPSVRAESALINSSGVRNITYTYGAGGQIEFIDFDIPAGTSAAYILYDEHAAQCDLINSHAHCRMEFPVPDNGNLEFVVR